MPRILTGIQSSGIPHLGNIFGAIKPAISLSTNPKNESFFFIADLHSLTSLKDATQRKQNIYATAATWLSFGFDAKKHVFYRQSYVPEVTELAWYLNCFTPFPMLANATAFKEKSAQLSDINAGLFVYPVLQAADIIGYDVDLVPVGKDQQQNIEIARDIAKSFNHYYQKEVFVLPKGKITKDVEVIQGTDGRKMSKSYNNFINIFAPENELKKQIMSIVTDSKPLEEPKDPFNCNVFSLYKLIASSSKVDNMAYRYQEGGYGYGHAKNELFSYILENFDEERKQFVKLMNYPCLIEEKLKIGEEKARAVLSNTLLRVREVLGFS